MDSNPANKSFKVPAIAGEAPQPLSHQHRSKISPFSSRSGEKITKQHQSNSSQETSGISYRGKCLGTTQFTFIYERGRMVLLVRIALLHHHSGSGGVHSMSQRYPASPGGKTQKSEPSRWLKTCTETGRNGGWKAADVRFCPVKVWQQMFKLEYLKS